MRRAAEIPDLGHLARKLRREQTPAEEILWALVRGRKLLRLKFRRQQQLGPFIADFYCHEARLVVELDGGIHSEPEQVDRDRNREVFLEENRLKVLREIAIATGRWDNTMS